MKSTEDITGYSEISIDEAIQNALNNTSKVDQVEVVESLGVRGHLPKGQYRVTLKARQD